MQIPELNESLLGYKGGRARLWHFTATHNRLAIELNHPNGEQRAYLVLLGCTEIRLPTGWAVDRPVVSTDEAGFVFVDNDVRVAFAYEFQLNDRYQH